MKLRGSSRFNVFLLFPLHPCVGRKEQGGHCVTLCGIFCQQTLVNKVWMSHFFVILVSSDYCVEMTDQTRSDSTIICKSLPPFLSCFHPFTWLCSGSIVLQNIHVVPAKVFRRAMCASSSAPEPREWFSKTWSPCKKQEDVALLEASGVRKFKARSRVIHSDIVILDLSEDADLWRRPSQTWQVKAAVVML